MQPTIASSVLVCALVAVLTGFVQGAIKEVTEENCEVCVKFLGKFIETLDDATKSSPQKIENAFIKYCKTAKKDDNRFCYYVGGTADSATSILNEMTKPISWSMPVEKICLKLYKKDEQICDLKYDKELDLSKADFKKMKVKELKKILDQWDEGCRGCTEKSDFIARIEELLPKHAPESAAARQKNEL